MRLGRRRRRRVRRRRRRWRQLPALRLGADGEGSIAGPVALAPFVGAVRAHHVGPRAAAVALWVAELRAAAPAARPRPEKERVAVAERQLLPHDVARRRHVPLVGALAARVQRPAVEREQLRRDRRRRVRRRRARGRGRRRWGRRGRRVVRGASHSARELQPVALPCHQIDCSRYGSRCSVGGPARPRAARAGAAAARRVVGVDGERVSRLEVERHPGTSQSHAQRAHGVVAALGPLPLLVVEQLEVVPVVSRQRDGACNVARRAGGGRVGHERAAQREARRATRAQSDRAVARGRRAERAGPSACKRAVEAFAADDQHAGERPVGRGGAQGLGGDGLGTERCCGCAERAVRVGHRARKVGGARRRIARPRDAVRVPQLDGDGRGGVGGVGGVDERERLEGRGRVVAGPDERRLDVGFDEEVVGCGERRLKPPLHHRRRAAQREVGAAVGADRRHRERRHQQRAGRGVGAGTRRPLPARAALAGEGGQVVAEGRGGGWAGYRILRGPAIGGGARGEAAVDGRWGDLRDGARQLAHLDRKRVRVRAEAGAFDGEVGAAGE